MSATSYSMPKVEIGDIVMWGHSPGRKDSFGPALVTQVYLDKIDCTVFAKDCRGGMPKTAVRHVSDPTIPSLTPEALGDGVFDFTERHKLVDGLIRQAYGSLKAKTE